MTEKYCVVTGDEQFKSSSVAEIHSLETSLLYPFLKGIPLCLGLLVELNKTFKEVILGTGKL